MYTLRLHSSEFSEGQMLSKIGQWQLLLESKEIKASHLSSGFTNNTFFPTADKQNQNTGIQLKGCPPHLTISAYLQSTSSRRSPS